MRSATSKFLALRRFGQATRELSSGHHALPPEGFQHLVRLNMNQGYPVPNQLYSEAYGRRQAKNNKILAGAALFLASAITFVVTQESFSFLSPPPRKVNL